MLVKLFGLGGLTPKQMNELGEVLVIATAHGEVGVIDWAHRAISDAASLGHMRDRDVSTLERLKRQFNGSEYYNRAPTGAIAA